MRSTLAQLVKWYTVDQRVSGLRLTSFTVLCPSTRHLMCCLVLVQPRKTGNHPDMTEKLLSIQTFLEPYVDLRDSLSYAPCLKMGTTFMDNPLVISSSREGSGSLVECFS